TAAGTPARAGRAVPDPAAAAHGAADEALLPGERGRRALADDDELLPVVRLAPREVVMVVHELELAAAQDLHDLARDPLAARVRVAPRQLHQVPVVVAERRVEREQHLAFRHALAPAAALAEREERGRDGVAEAA